MPSAKLGAGPIPILHREFGTFQGFSYRNNLNDHRLSALKNICIYLLTSLHILLDGKTKKQRKLILFVVTWPSFDINTFNGKPRFSKL